MTRALRYVIDGQPRYLVDDLHPERLERLRDQWRRFFGEESEIVEVDIQPRDRIPTQPGE